MITQKQIPLSTLEGYEFFLQRKGTLVHKEGHIVNDWHCFKEGAVRSYYLQYESGIVKGGYSHNELLENFVIVVNVECTEQFIAMYQSNYGMGMDLHHQEWQNKKDTSKINTHYLHRWIDEDGKQVGEIELVKR
jgi:hypothetical protein